MNLEPFFLPYLGQQEPRILTCNYRPLIYDVKLYPLKQKQKGIGSYRLQLQYSDAADWWYTYKESSYKILQTLMWQTVVDGWIMVLDN